MFESIVKSETSSTSMHGIFIIASLRVLLNQKRLLHAFQEPTETSSLRVLLNQKRLLRNREEVLRYRSLRVLLNQKRLLRR